MKTMLKKLRSENGSFLSTAIFLGVVFAIMAVGIIDGLSVFNAYRTAGNVSEDAARAGIFEYKLNHNDLRAQEVAVKFCEDKGLEFVDFQVHREQVHAYEVKCSTDAMTYVFKSLPWFKNLIHQENSGFASDTS
jgi:Flp pilus assembly protein TadG